MASIDVAQNKRWQIFTLGLEVGHPRDLLLSLKHHNLIYDMDDAEWMKRRLDVVELSCLVYASDAVVPSKWLRLTWILEVFGHDENALFIALQRYQFFMTPSWLLEHFHNHWYIYHFMNKQFTLDTTSLETYFTDLASLTCEHFLWCHLIGTGLLYTTSCAFLKSILSHDKYNLAIDERLDKLEL